ncbi:829_t:CDS:1 [Funneliformis geosporum]|nr:829_t:CDS:1 [Funneliformis geosporum]
MLGRIELVTQQLCGGQPRLFRNLGYQAYPPVFSLENPPSLPITTTSLQSRGWFNSSFSYITDAYTWRCLVYFMMIKSFLSIITFITTILAVTISIPLALCLLGPALYLVKTVGVWQKEVAFEFLVL